jgi:hypothetical protein
MRAAIWAPTLTAVLTGGAAVASMIYKHPVLGMNGGALVDAGIASIVAWRIYRLSLPWAVAGLLIFLAENILTFFTDPEHTAAGIIGVIMLLYYINTVRAGLYLKRNRNAEPVAVS